MKKKDEKDKTANVGSEKIIKVIRIHDEIYPQLLREIKDPPEKLYCIGNMELLKKTMVGIVGSRRSSAYGRWAAKALGENLSKNNITVVSGLAVGIDSCAHTGAVEYEGSTIAVLGAGLDARYPATNLKLRKIIEENGLVLTEYEEGALPTKYTFPRRNRIISGLSQATVVVEGGVNSGAVITAELAAEQGRMVYAIPGNINNEYSLATNKLIKDGAIPLIFFDDLIYDLGQMPVLQIDAIKKLSAEERKILEILRKEGEMNVNEIQKKTSSDIREINGMISVLEIKGLVFSSMGKVFLAK